VQQTFRNTLVVLGTVALAYLLYLIGDLVIVFFIAIVLASTMRPAVDKLAEWRVPKGLAAVGVLVLALLVILGLLALTVPSFVNMVIDLFRGQELRVELNRLGTELRGLGWRSFRVLLPPLSLPEQLNSLLDTLENQAEAQAMPLAGGVAYTLAQLVLTLVMAVYWLTSRESALELLLRLSPRQRRAKISKVWDDVETTLGAYMRGQLTLMLVVGLACFLGLLILGVPHAPALALLAGLTEAIPLVGPFIGGVPAVLLGLTVSWKAALLVAGWYVLVQQLEAHLLVPRIMQRAVGLNPLLVIVALVAGSTLRGVLGALLAIPTAAALQILTRQIVLDPVIDRRAAEGKSEVLIPGQEGESEVLIPEQEGASENVP
jgi:predicted PurR-regulated permease PerM